VRAVVGLWRYPVKGLLGEALDVAAFDEGGVVGDRAWAIVGADGKLASGKTTRRFRRMPGLFTMSATTGDDGTVVVSGAGWSGAVDHPETARRVSEVVGEPVTIRHSSSIPVRVHDEGPVHVVSAAELPADVRRFRPNVLLDGDPVEPGDVVDLGRVVLRATHRMPRCVMTTLAQPSHGLDFDPSLARVQELGVVADVVEVGTLHR
jgi:uncharacterized protein YcbX